MNVLVIAPAFGLPAAADEARAISLALHPVILSGNVSRRDVLDALRSHNWDIIWFVSHGNESGIQLSDAALPTSDLTAIVRSSGAWLIVLNTCSSRLIGLELHYELGVSVITTVGVVDDLAAYQAGALLAQELAETHDVVAAYEASRPGQNANYLLFHQPRQSDDAEEARTILMLNEWGARLSSKIDGLERRLDHELGALRNEINELGMRAVVLPPWHRVAFAGAFTLMMVPLPLFFDQLREHLAIGWQSAMVLAMMSYIASAIVWSYMWLGGRRSDD